MRADRAWTMGGFAGDSVVVQDVEAPRPEGLLPLALVYVEGLFERWLEDPESRPRLMDMLASVGGPLGYSLWEPQAQDRLLRTALWPHFDLGRLIVLGAPPLWFVPGKGDPPKPRPPITPIPPKPTDTWFSLRLVDDVGSPIEGIEILIDVLGTPHTKVTDASGTVRVEHVDSGFATARIPKTQPVRDALRPRWSRPRKPTVKAGPHFFVQRLHDPLDPVSLENETPATLAILPRLDCAEVSSPAFDYRRSFVLRTAGPVLGQVARALTEDDLLRAMVFGHADIGGTELEDKESSERRARSVRALLTRDAAAWEALWTGSEDDPSGFREIWSTREIQHILNTLGQTPPLREDGVEDPATKNALRAFLTEATGSEPPEELDASGRQALFTRYAAALSPTPVDAARFGKPGGSDFMGCGVYNPLHASAKDAPSRRVVLFTFDPAAEPQSLPCKLRDVGPCRAVVKPPGESASPPAPGATPKPYRCPVYVDFATACPCQGGSPLRHDLLIRFPFSKQMVKSLPDEFVLRSGDGTIEMRQKLSKTTIADSQGAGEITFSGLPDVLDYHLRSEGIDAPYEVFGKTPFRKLATLGQPETGASGAGDHVALTDEIPKGGETA